MNKNIKHGWALVTNLEADRDPVLAALVRMRRQAKRSMEDADAAIRTYRLRVSEVVPDEWLMILTPGQAQVLELIVDSYLKTGISPTSREVADEMGWSSGTSAVNAISALVEKGYVHKVSKQWRSLIPLFDSSRKRVANNTSKK
jgi:DNA-binding MarR family transcriptional regulator